MERLGKTRAVAELIPVLYRQTSPGIVAHVVTSSVLAAFLWGDVADRKLWPWLAAVYALSALRGASVWWFFRYPGPHPSPVFWGRLASGFAGAFGILWGACPWLFMAPDNLNSLVIICVINMGLGAGAVVALAPYLPACLAFALPTQLGLISALLNQPQPLTLAIAALAGYALAANLTNSVMVHRRLSENVRLTHDNQRLREDAEQKNRLLEVSLRSASQARESAERANAAKTRFLAAASHDLRQPVHALGLFFEDLANQVNSPASQPLIERINDSIRAIDSMLSALLDISKLDAGVVQPDYGTVALRPLVRRLQKEFQPVAERTGNALHVRVREADVTSDGLMLERLLRNLLSNALRYTQRGKVLLAVRPLGTTVRVDVCDTGIGIPGAQLQEIFTEFHQLGNPQRDRRQGLGLGLAIVKRIADLLGHDIHVHSLVGRGSRFRVTLKRAQPASQSAREEPDTAPDRDDLHGFCVLVLDDDKYILDAMQSLLRSWGVVVLGAASISAAADLLESSTHRPQLLLVDYRLQDRGTGIQAIHGLQHLLEENVPAVLLTGDTAPDRLRQAQASGIPLLYKPVRPAELRSLLRSFLPS
ncbi:MAG: ATP-binding protein [Gammaproteobacteria bacterium]|nr:ATP-binding protein [Gammaproteobacteria bacterium]